MQVIILYVWYDDCNEDFIIEFIQVSVITAAQYKFEIHLFFENSDDLVTVMFSAYYLRGCCSNSSAAEEKKNSCRNTRSGAWTFRIPMPSSCYGWEEED